MQIDWLDFLQTVFRDSGVRLTSEHEVYTGGSSYIKHILQLFKNSNSRQLGKTLLTGYRRLNCRLYVAFSQTAWGFLSTG
jgi:hypothetical protein